ncbi:MAG TPA: class I SAM-dependent methyltransferase [Dehalococcoidia bacterium]|nr:class I SAM-dependent methyltransferase [Dehalococcoidia bacterium]
MTDPKQAAIRKFGAGRVESPLDVIERYATDVEAGIETLLSAVGEALPAGGRLCELGFGSGWLLQKMVGRWPAARVIGLDLSAAFVERAQREVGDRAAIVRGDMDALPFRDGALDVAITCWTLYFMHDIDATLREIRRCVRPGGRVIAATVAADHMHELPALIDDAVRAALGREPEPDIGARFDLASGAAYMQRNFAHVELREWRGEMVLPDVGTTMLLWPNYGPQLEDPGEDAAARTAFEHAVRGVIEREGALRMMRHDGAFVAAV